MKCPRCGYKDNDFENIEQQINMELAKYDQGVRDTLRHYQREVAVLTAGQDYEGFLGFLQRMGYLGLKGSEVLSLMSSLMNTSFFISKMRRARYPWAYIRESITSKHESLEKKKGLLVQQSLKFGTNN